MSKKFSAEQVLDLRLSDSESEEEGSDEVYYYSGQAVCKRGELSALERMVDSDSSKVPPQSPVKTILVLLNSRRGPPKRVKGWSWTLQVRINRVV